MLKSLFVSAMLFLGACCGGPNKVQVKIENKTSIPIVIRAGSSIFGASVVVEPGASWNGWVDRRWVASSAWIVVEQK